MNKNNIYINYSELIKSLQNFKRVDYEGFNRFDSPSSIYFKIIFYFNEDQGLLGLNQMKFDNDTTEFENMIANLKSVYNNLDGDEEQPNSVRKVDSSIIKNTAYHYLLLNDELERAEMLKSFVKLLSDINSKSPWYFTEISGIDTALERKFFDEPKLEERKALTIKCLPDSFDSRIGTLLDLYRAICYSYQMKREVVPANLRKFNMGILLFNQPIRGFSGKSGFDSFVKIPDSTDLFFVSSCKLLEFRNCEIDQNSSKSAWTTVKTEESIAPEYTIQIFYDDCYESRYNEIMQYVITDFINIDLNITTDRNQKIQTSTPEYIRPIKLSNGGPNAKSYWTNTDIEKSNPYDNPMVSNNDSNAIRDINDTGSKGPIENLVTNSINKFTSSIKIPTIKSENIHDNGTVQKYGAYEYINRVSNGDGLIGQAMSTMVGVPSKFIRDKVTSLYLGNMYGNSVANYLDYAKRIVNGDVIGAAQLIKKEVDNKKKNKEKSKNKAIPGYKTAGQKSAGNVNKKKSIFNNL